MLDAAAFRSGVRGWGWSQRGFRTSLHPPDQRRLPRVPGLGFWVSGFGSRVPGLGSRSRVPGLGLGFRVSDFGKRKFCFGFQGSGLQRTRLLPEVGVRGVPDSGLVFRVQESTRPALFRACALETVCTGVPRPKETPTRNPGFGCRVSGFGFRVSGFGFRVSGFGFRVSGAGSRSVPDPG